MARAIYLPAAARCRQLERIIRKQPGITVSQLASQVRISYRTAAAYVVRLDREQRLVIRLDQPATPRGCTKRLFEPEIFPPQMPPANKKAA